MKGRRRDIALMLLGAVLASVLISPAGAHVGGTVAHLWSKHIKPNVTQLVYTKSQANGRFLRRPTQDGAYRVNGSTWIDEDATHSIQIAGTGPVSTWCTITSGSAAHQQVFLPQGAKVTGVQIQYVDNNASNGDNGGAYLIRDSMSGAGGSYSDLHSGDFPDTAVEGEMGTATLDLYNANALVVDNTRYTYMLKVSPVAGASVCTATVTYDQPPAPTTGVAG